MSLRSRSHGPACPTRQAGPITQEATPSPLLEVATHYRRGTTRGKSAVAGMGSHRRRGQACIGQRPSPLFTSSRRASLRRYSLVVLRILPFWARCQRAESDIERSLARHQLEVPMHRVCSASRSSAAPQSRLPSQLEVYACAHEGASPREADLPTRRRRCARSGAAWRGLAAWTKAI